MFKVSNKAGKSASGKGLKDVREKLKKDRFRDEEGQSTSKVEEVMIKKLAEKQKRKKTLPEKQIKKKEIDDDKLGDIWSEPPKASKSV